MSVYFFDSSGLVKRYITETGTNWVRATIAPSARNLIFVSQFAAVEAVSAFMRRVRDKSISARTAQAARILVNRHMRREYRIVGVSDSILIDAQRLLELYPLRGFDAIQLASALDINTRLKAANLQPLTFVCADMRLLNVATAEGLQIHYPV